MLERLLERLFGWRKTSKCKALLKLTIRRIKLVQNKRKTQVKQLRQDIAQLLKNGQHQSCFNRVELLFKEQNLVEAYNMIEILSECILGSLSYMRKYKDLPHDINKAVSSLKFCAARCADLPELRGLRELFSKRYGHEVAVDVHPDSACVDKQIIEQLSGKSPTLDLKLNLMKGVAEEFKIPWDSSIICAELGLASPPQVNQEIERIADV